MFIGSGRRSGTRGGADQFTWDSVKADKYKEFYLGHSLHTTEKPTFNNRKPNPLWWTKKDGSNQTAKEELARIKEQEDQLMKEALGLAPKRKIVSGQKLDSTDLDQLTKRGQTERDGVLDTERVAGLGFAPHHTHTQTEQLKAESHITIIKPGESDNNVNKELNNAVSSSQHMDSPLREDSQQRKQERKERKRRRKEEREERRKDRYGDKKKRKRSRSKERHSGKRSDSSRDKHKEHDDEHSSHHSRTKRRHDPTTSSLQKSHHEIRHKRHSKRHKDSSK